MTAPPSALRVAVIGAGAIGGLIAYRMSAAGYDVGVVARGAHLQAIRSHGLGLVERAADRALAPRPMLASDRPSDLGPRDIVFVALKAHALPSMAQAIASILTPTSVVVPTINGLPWWYFHGVSGPLADWRLGALDPHGTMFADLDSARVIGCVVHAAAEVIAPGQVQHTNGGRFVLGELNGAATPRLAQVVEAMRTAGFEPEPTDDIRHAVWWKLIGNMSFNPVAALHRKLIHEICEEPPMRAIVVPLIREGMAIAAALGVTLSGTAEDRIDVARRLRGAKISMHQDLDAGRRLEIDAIVKAPREVARRVGVATPTLDEIDAQITALAISRGLYP